MWLGAEPRRRSATPWSRDTRPRRTRQGQRVETVLVHGVHFAGRRGAVGEMRLGQDARHVRLDRLLADRRWSRCPVLLAENRAASAGYQRDPDHEMRTP